MLTHCGNVVVVLGVKKRPPNVDLFTMPKLRREGQQGLLTGIPQNPGVQLQYKLPGFCCEPVLRQSYIHPTVLSISFTCVLLSTNGCFDVILVVLLQFGLLTPQKIVA